MVKLIDNDDTLHFVLDHKNLYDDSEVSYKESVFRTSRLTWKLIIHRYI